MSTVACKRSWSDALADAEEFKSLFAGCYERWEVAGSIRRRKSECGDVDHVIIARCGDRKVPGALFPIVAEVNLLWHRCDELLAAGEIEQHVYHASCADGSTRPRVKWGNVQRGVSFRGHLHELCTAGVDNWGAILAIKTGPADFSKMMVTRIQSRGLQQLDGYVRYMRDGAIYPVRTEQAFFEACGVAWREPRQREVR